MSTLLVLGIKKNCFFFNVILRIIECFENHSPKMYFNSCVEGSISEGLFDTAHETTSAQAVGTIKLQLPTYNSFLTGETQGGACECLMLVI